jgi:hypothetical protein
MDSDIATLLSGKEPVFSKNSAFNKNWAGSSGNYGTADTPARSDHLHAGAVSETGTQTLTNKTLTEPIILTNGAPTFGNTKGKMGVYDTGTAVEFYFGTGAAVRTLLDNNNWPTKIPKITISADGNPAGDEQIGSIMIDLSA